MCQQGNQCGGHVRGVPRGATAVQQAVCDGGGRPARLVHLVGAQHTLDEA